MASLSYLAFLGAVLALCALFPRWRVGALLAASAAFVAVEAGALVFASILALALATWALGRSLQAELHERRQLRLLWAGVGLNLLPLILFKYVALLPALGLSYFCFSSIAYLSDLYFKTAEAQPFLARHLLGAFFFPKYIQGPIERPRDLDSQWNSLGQADGAQLRLGAVLIVWGLFKKLVVAERLGAMVDPVFQDLAAHSAGQRLWAAYLFSAQLFADFSGYTDLALGSALLLGIRLTQNFDGPYAAVSMVDFWRRWHLSLSTWIRDYVFQPLQMASRNWGLAGAALSLFLAFFLMGVWHGATWGYAVFGLIQGGLMAGQLLWQNYYKGLRKRFGGPKELLPDVLGWLLTFHVVILSFVYFRAASLGDAWLLLRSAPEGWLAWARSWPAAAEWAGSACLGQPGADAAIAGLGVLLMIVVYPLRKRWRWESMPAAPRWALYLGLLFVTLLAARYYAVKQFIYAQF